MWKAGQDEAQAEIKITGRNIKNLRHVGDTIIVAESEDEKEPIDESKWGECKSCLKLKIQKTNIMASSPITSWQINGETMKTVTDFIFLGSKITMDGDCTYEIKRCLLLERKVMTNLDSFLKNSDNTLLTKVLLVKAMVFQ